MGGNNMPNRQTDRAKRDYLDKLQAKSIKSDRMHHQALALSGNRSNRSRDVVSKSGRYNNDPKWNKKAEGNNLKIKQRHKSMKTLELMQDEAQLAMEGLELEAGDGD